MSRALDVLVDTSLPLPAAALPRLSAPAPDTSESERWRAWQHQGRYDDARFRRKLRRVLIEGAAVATLGAALWMAFVTLL